MNENIDFEYSTKENLKGSKGIYFTIPEKIILDKDISKERISLFSYFLLRRGLDKKVFFRVCDIVKWVNKKPSNGNLNGIEHRLIRAIQELGNTDFLTLSDEFYNDTCKPTTFVNAELNIDEIMKQNKKGCRFATIYLDEVEKIINYKGLSPKDTYMNNDIVLLVLAYLRTKIVKRPNNCYEYDVEQRKKYCPEVHACFYNEIGEAIGITEKAVSKAISILKELGIIYFETLPRTKVKISEHETKWQTNRTLVCNMYKREGGCLLDSGKGYYLTEIKNKKALMKI